MTIHDLIVIAGLVAAGVIALAGLFRPFLGLIVLIAIRFIQPGELLPALGKLRIEFAYGVALLIAFVIYRASRPSPRLLSNRIVYASLLLVGAACMSVPFAVWRGGAFWQTAELIKTVIVLFLVAGLVDTTSRMRKLLWTLVGLLGWFAASGLISYLHGDFIFREGIERAEGVNSMAGGPNELAGLILALLPFVIVLLKCTRSILIRLLLLACGGLGLATMVVTGSRICMLALIAIAAYYGLRSRQKIPALVLGAGLLVALWVAMPQQYRERYLTVKHYAEGGELDASNAYRLHIWRVGRQMFLDHPILGVGAGQFPTAFGTIYATRLHQAWASPHNLFLQIACEMGVVGLIAFAYFFVQIVKQIRSVPRAYEGPLKLNYEVAVACGVMLLGLVVTSTVGHTLYRPYWYLLGGLVAANRLIADTILGGESATVPADQATESEDYEERNVPVALMREGSG
jgi:O-antigen ligase